MHVLMSQCSTDPLGRHQRAGLKRTEPRINIDRPRSPTAPCCTALLLTCGASVAGAAQPTAGLVEVEPSMAWNPAVLSGIGVVDNVRDLYHDVHSYLAASGAQDRFREGVPACCVMTWL